jgi:hypothetical protein
MLGSPKRTSLTWSPFLARTADFFFALGVLLGLLKPPKVSPRYFNRPLPKRSTFLVLAILAVFNGHSGLSALTALFIASVTNGATTHHFLRLLFTA